MEDRFRVGVLANTHGIHGEMKLFPTTDDVSRFVKGLPVILDTGKGELALEIESVKYFKNMVILKFKGYDSINDIEKYKGRDVYVTREHAIPLEEDEYYIADVLGAKVVTEEGEELGILKEVLQTGANDVYVVTMEDGREVLLPVIPECVLAIDVENKEIRVHVMKGLLD